jgi:hypothetical protein
MIVKFEIFERKLLKKYGYKRYNFLITDFPFIKENLNVDKILPIGTTVRVLPKLEEFIEKHYLNNSWNRIIGKILEIQDFIPNHSECKEDVYVLNTAVSSKHHFGFIVPINCVEKAYIDKTSSEHDPYGEEDWNDDVYTFEQVTDKIDWNDERIPIGMEVICLDGQQDAFHVGGWKGVVIDYSENGNGDLNGKSKRGLMYLIRFNNSYCNTYYVFREIVRPIDENYLKKREELRLSHLDTDPYGEEDWFI